MDQPFWTSQQIEDLATLAAASDRERHGSLDHPMTLDQAERTEVKFQGKMRPLIWMVSNRPARLEVLMDTTPPGSVLFHAIALVYNAHLPAILAGVKPINDRMRRAGKAALRRSRDRMTVRPITRRLMRVRLITHRGPR